MIHTYFIHCEVHLEVAALGSSYFGILKTFENVLAVFSVFNILNKPELE